LVPDSAGPSTPRRASNRREFQPLSRENAIEVQVNNYEVEQLGQVAADHFGRHRDAERYLSQPGLGVVLGARILGEFGDDPHRYADAKARRNYAGTSPITRASVSKRVCWPATPATAASATPSTNGRSAL
jgi:transposase